MTARRTPWIVVAVAEAVAIALVIAQLVGGEPAAAPPAAVPASGVERAEPDAAAPIAMPDSAAPATPLQRQRVPADPVAAEDRITPAPVPLGTLVHGAVRTADGRDLPDYVGVGLVPAGETKPIASGNLPHGVATFAWADVAAGSYEVRVRASGMRDAVTPFVVPAGAPELRVDVVLEPSWLVDVLLQTPDGRPLHEALRELPDLAGSLSDGVQVVALWHEIPTDIPRSELRQSPFTVAKWHANQGVSRERDARQLPARYAGTLEMPESRPAFAAVLLKEVVLARAPLAAGQQELELVVDPARIRAAFATLRLQVVGPDGAPLAGAKVGVNDRQSWRPPTAVDADGRLEQSGLLPGSFALTIQCDGHAFPPCTVELRPGAVTDLGQLRLAQRREFTIRVADAPAGDALRGSLAPLDAAPNVGLSPDGLRIGVRDGTARVVAAEGRYRLTLTGAGGAVLEFDTRALGSEPLVVTLAPEATIRFDPSQLDGPARLVVAAANGAVVLDRWVTWKGRWEQAVLPGSYRVTVQPLVGAARTESLDVPAAGASFTL